MTIDGVTGYGTDGSGDIDEEEDATSTVNLGARIARRALSGPVTGFADDVIEE